MDVYRSIDDIAYEPDSALTIGTFDGVHVGHRMIFEELLRTASAAGGRSIVLTFEPHPQVVLKKRRWPIPILTPLDLKLKLFEEAGIDVTVVQEFTLEFASTPWQTFVDRLIDHAGLVHMVVGHDHAFGKDREGNAESLREYGAEKGFTFTQVGPITVDGGPVSSTRIRRALQNGEVDDASRWLSRPYSIRGTVVEGDKRGRTIGYPTANLAPNHPEQLVPGNGVYAVRALLEGAHVGKIVEGMANIGRRPTLTEGEERTIEAHLFDWNDELYNQSLTLEFCTFLRSEQKFDSKESLVQQLDNDRQASLKYFAERQ